MIRRSDKSSDLLRIWTKYNRKIWTKYNRNEIV